jgi:hypothetical protein
MPYRLIMVGFCARAVLVALLLPSLASCGGTPMPFPVPESEMPLAPGLFSGPTGNFDIPLVKDKPPDPAPGATPAGAPK